MRASAVRISILLVLLIFPSLASADTPTQPQPVSTLNVWVPVIASAVGALIALITMFLKDYLIARLLDKKQKTLVQHEIFRNYVAPLASACSRLVWRFKEIFIDGGHQWLLLVTAPLDYNEYKRISTLYRIASLLGWIRAINLELSALPRGASGFATPISDAISTFQAALADGQNVELHRLAQLCDVWGFNLSQLSEDRRKQLATRLEVQLYSVAGDNIKREPTTLRDISEQEKFCVCLSLSKFLCTELNRAPLPDNVLREKLDTAIYAMTYKESLIYRDWQDAIGQSLIERDEESVRRYKIIGFEKFNDLLENSTHAWFGVLRESINDINFDVVDPTDFRTFQLKEIAISVSNILIAIANTPDSDLVDALTLQVARKLVAPSP